MRGCRYRGENAKEKGKGCRFGTCGEEGSDGRGSAFVNVGSPNLEGSSGDFEAEADEDASEAEFEEAALRIDSAHAGKSRGAGGAVNERDTKEKECSGERAKQEILERRFAGLEGVATVTGEDVAGDRTHFEADEC